jgi:1,4-dihydroxy-6-naphthoate synthase
MTHYSIGFSPCPNDTFIFDALIHERINMGTSHFNPQLLDVEALNKAAASSLLDVTKLSFSAFAFVSEQYQILPSGSALGRGCGPLIVSKNKLELSDLKNLRIAIPGKYTTANLLMSIFMKEEVEIHEMLFSDIEDAVLSGICDAGLIIHENRFTYAQKGLHKVADMGELWEQRTGLPIPLGCIAIKRSLPDFEKRTIGELIKSSVQFAFDNPLASENYVMQHAAEMSKEVQRQHIELYVNEFSIDLAKEGQRAIRMLFQEGITSGILPELKEPIFVE